MTSWSEAAPFVAMTGLVIVAIVVVAVVIILVVSFAQEEADQVRARRLELEDAADERSATRSWAAWLARPDASTDAEREAWVRERMQERLDEREEAP